MTNLYLRSFISDVIVTLIHSIHINCKWCEEIFVRGQVQFLPHVLISNKKRKQLTLSFLSCILKYEKENNKKRQNDDQAYDEGNNSYS